MKGNEQVIEILNEVLCAELTAVNQYWIHHRMLKDWGYGLLASHAREESLEEMKHADGVIERILFLDGVPNMQKYGKVSVGRDVEEQHRFDLAIELEAVEHLNKGIAICRELGDNGTRELLEGILREEEGHVDWIETHLHMIEELGLQNYLVTQVSD